MQDEFGLDLKEQIARIERAQAETRKFAAEQNKLAAEAAKLGRDRWLAPVVVVFSGIGAIGGLAAAIRAFHLWGVT